MTNRTLMKPCPFCGGEATMRIYENFEDVNGNIVPTYKTPQIECHCGINFTLNDPNWGSLEAYEMATIRNWNRRADNE